MLGFGENVPENPPIHEGHDAGGVSIVEWQQRLFGILQSAVIPPKIA